MRPLGIALALLLPLGGCSAPVVGDYASGKVQGGDPLPWVSTPCSFAPGTAGSDTSWNYLYTHYFGPPIYQTQPDAGSIQTGGFANCGVGGCHSDTGTNAFAVSGFKCGSTVGDCYIGMTTGQGGSAVTGPIVPPGATDATKTPLYFYLAKQGTGSCGTMPKNGSYVFSPNDMATISAWITQGAPGP